MSILEGLVDGLKHCVEDVKLWTSLGPTTISRDGGPDEDIREGMVEHASRMADWYRSAIRAVLSREED